MSTLHRYIPVSFKDSYTPIAAAGTHTQVQCDVIIHYIIMMSWQRVHLARLLASQLTSANVGNKSNNEQVCTVCV